MFIRARHWWLFVRCRSVVVVCVFCFIFQFSSGRGHAIAAIAKTWTLAASMFTRLTIATIFIILSLTSLAQTSSLTFHRHLQTCHIVGTTETDFTITLNDSLITIIQYSKNYTDNYSSIIKLSYKGIFIQKGDTIIVHYLTKDSEYKSKKKQTVLKTSDNAYLIYPSNTFIISEGAIESADRTFPTLNRLSVSAANRLERQFQSWGDIKTIDQY